MITRVLVDVATDFQKSTHSIPRIALILWRYVRIAFSAPFFLGIWCCLSFPNGGCIIFPFLSTEGKRLRRHAHPDLWHITTSAPECDLTMHVIAIMKPLVDGRPAGDTVMSFDLCFQTAGYKFDHLIARKANRNDVEQNSQR